MEVVVDDRVGISPGRARFRNINVVDCEDGAGRAARWWNNRRSRLAFDLVLPLRVRRPKMDGKLGEQVAGLSAPPACCMHPCQAPKDAGPTAGQNQIDEVAAQEGGFA